MYSVDFFNLDIAEINQNNSKLLNETANFINSNIVSKTPFYKIFQKQDAEKAIKSLVSIADNIKNNFSDLIIISMGGANLNPQMLVDFVGNEAQKINIHFLHNTDPIFFANLVKKIDLKNSAFLAISNSGKTLETISLVSCMIAEYKKHNIKNIAGRSFFITNPREGVIKDIASNIGGHLLPHQSEISGRYSGLSSVSLLVGLIADIDVASYINGANEVIDDFQNNLHHSKPILSASAIYFGNKQILVNIGYLQKFTNFLEWYSQIIAESLGKNNMGYTPIKGIGPNDQHSTMQLYLDGPKDKLFTMFYIQDFDNNINNYKTDELKAAKYLSHKSLLAINQANFDATLKALDSKSLAIRKIILQNIAAKTFGAITAHSMLEIVFIGHLMKINPFNQPGVQLIKDNITSLMLH